MTSAGDRVGDADDAELDDDAALQWAGDEELGRDSTSGSAAAQREQAEDDADENVEDAPARAPLAPFAVAVVLALAAAVGWGIIVAENPVSQDTLLALALYQLGEFLVVVAPLLAVIVVQRIAVLATRQRIVWWLVGLVVTAPWPLVVGGAA